MHTVIKYFTHIHFVEFQIEKNKGKVYIFIFKIGKNYAIGWYFFTKLYIKKDTYSMWNNNLAVCKLSFFSLFLILEEIKKGVLKI